jgi:predicted dehydrogenase
MELDRNIRYGMVGGGPGAFIGAVHRSAAALDGEMDLVAGAFSSSPEKSKEQGENLNLDPDRVYGSYEEMAEQEAERSDGIDAVSIVTPNFLHYDVAKTFLDKGFHVICDKPLTTTLDDAEDLCRRVEEQDVVFCLTHNYSGYPLVKQARALVDQGRLGDIRKIVVEYPQGWLNRRLEQKGNKQASWRTDPERSGAGGAIGDIGTHAANLAEYVTGLNITEICADINTKVDGRLLDDDAAALLRFEEGATGVLMVSQVAAGEENDIKLRVYGEKSGLEWEQTDQNTLLFKPLEGPHQIIRTGTGYLSEHTQANTRTPAGHPEGYLEAFANIYIAFHKAVVDHQDGEYKSANDYDFPDVVDGIRGMAFVDTMIESSKSETKWTPIKL